MLQFRSDTGAVLMLDSGSLANECCCVGIPDLTPLMRSLSEALHYIADENSLNQEFGGAQGDAWPTQRTAPFFAPPADGEDIPPDFYEADYTADIQNAYDDLALIITNYNYVKNFFLKTDPSSSPATLSNYTGADDYSPGAINAGNFESIRQAIIALTNDILNVMVQASQVVDCNKNADARGLQPDWATMEACAENSIDTENCGEYTLTDDPIGPGCTISSVTPAFTPGIGGYEGFFQGAPTSEADLWVGEGHIQGDLSNFTSAANSEIYLKLGIIDPAFPFSNPAIKPVSSQGVYLPWIAQGVGAVFNTVTVTGSDQKIPFTYAGGPDDLTSSWTVDDQVAILTRAQTHVAS